MSAGTPGAPPPPQPPSDPGPGAPRPGDPGQQGQQGQSGPYGPYGTPAPGQPASGPSPAYGHAPAYGQPGQQGQQAQSGPSPVYGQVPPFGQPGRQAHGAPAASYGPQVADGRATASGRAAVAGAFAAPPGMSWARVSPRLAWYRRIQVLVVAVVVMIVGVFLAARVLGLPGGVVVLVAVLACAAVAWLLAEFNTRSWCYLEQADEFLMTHGVLIRRFVVIPYGRMQLVDVNSNVLQQALGIATVRLYTAAATTDARLPGIPRQEAERLRDRLVAKSEARSMGL